MPILSNTKRKLLTVMTVIIIAVAIVGGGYWYMSGGAAVHKDANDQPQAAANIPAPPPAVSGDVKIGTDPYTLTDMNGQTITEKSFPDKFKLVFFGFTHCGDICPIATQTMARALDNLGPDAQKVQVLFISVDPKSDTPKVLQDYLKNFSSAILGVTGTDAQVKSAEDSFKAYASESTAEGEGDEAHHHMDMGADDKDAVNHSDNIYLLAPGNKFVNVFNGDVDANTLAQAIKTAINQ